MDLKNKIAIVTGVSKGIGLATSEALLREGAIVVGWGRNSPKIEDWHSMFDTNVHGLFYCSKIVIPEMKNLGEGHIINIASIAGTNGVENMAGYAATKHAVVGISHSLFKELRNDGIKVSCVCPGSVKTHFFDDLEGVNAHDNMMKPEDIASTILHILKSPPNYFHADIEVRPLMPKGK